MRLKPISIARLRTCWRTRTTSSAVRTAADSLRSTSKPVLRAVDQATNEGEPLVDIERGVDPGQSQAELHQRDRHRRLHADDHGDGVEDARHGGDVVEHPP